MTDAGAPALDPRRTRGTGVRRSLTSACALALGVLCFAATVAGQHRPSDAPFESGVDAHAPNARAAADVPRTAHAAISAAPSQPRAATEPPRRAPSPAPPSAGPSGGLVRIVLGLIVLFALAILAGTSFVRRLERRAGVAMFIATGMPFLALGVIARLPSVGILSDALVRDLRPLLEFGLGWIGFRVGMEFDVREFDRLPSGSTRLLTSESATTFVLAGGACILVFGLSASHLSGGGFVRDGLILGACAAVSAPSGARLLEAVGAIDRRASRLIRKVALLGGIAPIVVIGLVHALFRPVQAARWLLPPLGWVFIEIGMGAVIGGLAITLERATRNINEEVALTIGVIAFASGMAGYLGLSPLAVGCVAGIVMANVMSGPDAGPLAARLRTLERPIYLIFFAVSGALWDVRSFAGWLVVPVYAGARILGKFLGARGALIAERRAVASEMAEAAAAATFFPTTRARVLSDPEISLSVEAPRPVRDSHPVLEALQSPMRVGIALMPTSAVSIAVIVSANLAYPRSIPGYFVTIVIAGAVISEVLFQVAVRFIHPGMSADDAEIDIEDEA